MLEKMASNQSWDKERTQTRTRKVHELEEVVPYPVPGKWKLGLHTCAQDVQITHTTIIL
jgi:hypothetical protein